MRTLARAARPNGARRAARMRFEMGARARGRACHEAWRMNGEMLGLTGHACRRIFASLGSSPANARLNLRLGIDLKGGRVSLDPWGRPDPCRSSVDPTKARDGREGGIGTAADLSHVER